MATDDQLNNQRELNKALGQYQSGLTDAAEFIGLLTSRSSDLVDQYRNLGKSTKNFTEGHQQTLSILKQVGKLARDMQNPYEKIRDVQKDIEKGARTQVNLQNSLIAAEQRLSRTQSANYKSIITDRKKILELEQEQITIEGRLGKKALEEAEKVLDLKTRTREQEEYIDELKAGGASKKTLDRAKSELDITQAQLQAKEKNLTVDQSDFILSEQILSSKRDELEKSEASLDTQTKMVLAIKEANEAQKQGNAYLEDQEKRLKNIEKSQRYYNNTIGLAGKILGKLGVSSSKFQDAVEAGKESSKELAKELTDGGRTAGGFFTKTRVFFKGLGEFLFTLRKELLLTLSVIALNKLILQPFKKVMQALAFPAKKVAGEIKGYFSEFVDYIVNSFISIRGFVDAFKAGEGLLKQISQDIEDVATGLGISTDEAKALKDQVKGLSGEMGAIPEKLAKNMVELNKAFGTTQRFSDETARSFNRMVERLGFSTETASELVKISVLQGEETNTTLEGIENQTLALKNQYGVAISSKQIFEDVAKASSATRLTLIGQGKEIENAAFHSRRLGLEMSKVNSIGESLLDFESSIAAEMEAELLLGRNLNLDRARQAALAGDTATIAKEIAGQIGSAAEFGNLNVIQQKALAKSIGVSRDELAGMLETQELLANTGFKDMSEAQQEFNKLVESGMSIEKAQAVFRKRYGNEALATQAASVSYAKQRELQERALLSAQLKMADAMMPVAQAIYRFQISLEKVRAVMVDQMRPFLKELGLLVDDGGEAFLRILEDYVKPLGKRLNDIGLTLIKFARENGPEIKETFESILGVFGAIYGKVGEIIAALFNVDNSSTNIADPLQRSLDIVKRTADSVASYIQNIDAEKVAERIQGIAKGIVTTVEYIIKAVKYVKENPWQVVFGVTGAILVKNLASLIGQQILGRGSIYNPMYVREIGGGAWDTGFKLLSRQIGGGFKTMGTFLGGKGTAAGRFFRGTSARFLNMGRRGGNMGSFFRAGNLLRGGGQAAGSMANASQIVWNEGAKRYMSTATGRFVSNEVGKQALARGAAGAGARGAAGAAGAAKVGFAGGRLAAGLASGGLTIGGIALDYYSDLQKQEAETFAQQARTARTRAEQQEYIKAARSAESTSDLAGVGGAALSGAGIGFMIGGPIGAGVGALIGGIYGAVKSYSSTSVKNIHILTESTERFYAAQDKLIKSQKRLQAEREKSERLEAVSNSQFAFMASSTQDFVNSSYRESQKITNVGESMKVFASELYAAGLITKNEYTEAVEGVIGKMDLLETAASNAQTQLNKIKTDQDVGREDVGGAGRAAIEQELNRKKEELEYQLRIFQDVQKITDPKAYLGLENFDAVSSDVITLASTGVDFTDMMALAQGLKLGGKGGSGFTVDDLKDFEAFLAKGNNPSMLTSLAQKGKITGVASVKVTQEEIQKLLEPFETVLKVDPTTKDLSAEERTNKAFEMLGETLVQNFGMGINPNARSTSKSTIERDFDKFSLEQLESMPVEDAAAMMVSLSGKYYTTFNRNVNKSVGQDQSNLLNNANIAIANIEAKLNAIEEGGLEAMNAYDTQLNALNTSLIGVQGAFDAANKQTKGKIGESEKIAKTFIDGIVESLDGLLNEEIKGKLDKAAKDGLLKTELDDIINEAIIDISTTAAKTGKQQVTTSKAAEFNLALLNFLQQINQGTFQFSQDGVIPSVQRVKDAASISHNGPFTIQDSQGNVAITHPKDKLVVSPNVSYVADGTTGKGGPVFPVSEKFGALDVKVGKEGVLVQKINDGITGKPPHNILQLPHDDHSKSMLHVGGGISNEIKEGYRKPELGIHGEYNLGKNLSLTGGLHGGRDHGHTHLGGEIGLKFKINDGMMGTMSDHNPFITTADPTKAPNYTTSASGISSTNRNPSITSADHTKAPDYTGFQGDPFTAIRYGVFHIQNNPDWFNNKSQYSDNPRQDDMIRKLVYQGTHGYNPYTQILHKLNPPVEVDEETTRLITSKGVNHEFDKFDAKQWVRENSGSIFWGMNPNTVVDVAKYAMNNPLDAIQVALGTISLAAGLSGIGEPISVVADLLNASISGYRAAYYALKGDAAKSTMYLGLAGLNLAAAVPVAGNVAGGAAVAKLAASGTKTGQAIKTGAVATQKFAGTVGKNVAVKQTAHMMHHGGELGITVAKGTDLVVAGATGTSYISKGTKGVNKLIGIGTDKDELNYTPSPKEMYNQYIIETLSQRPDSNEAQSLLEDLSWQAGLGGRIPEIVHKDIEIVQDALTGDKIGFTRSGVAYTLPDEDTLKRNKEMGFAQKVVYSELSGTTSSTKVASPSVLSDLGVSEVNSSNYKGLFRSNSLPFKQATDKKSFYNNIKLALDSQSLKMFTPAGKAPATDSFSINYAGGETDSIYNSGDISFPKASARYSDIESVEASGNGLLALGRAIAGSFNKNVPSKIKIGFQQERESTHVRFDSDQINDLVPDFNGIAEAIMYHSIPKEEKSRVPYFLNKEYIDKVGTLEYVKRSLSRAQTMFIPAHLRKQTKESIESGGTMEEVYSQIFGMTPLDFSTIENIINNLPIVSRRYSKPYHVRQLEEGVENIGKNYIPQYKENVLDFLAKHLTNDPEQLGKFVHSIKPKWYPTALSAQYDRLFQEKGYKEGGKGSTSLTKKTGEYAEGASGLQQINDGIGFWEVISDPMGAVKHYVLPELAAEMGHIIEYIFKSKTLSTPLKKLLHKVPLIGHAIHLGTGAFNISHLLHEGGMSEKHLNQEVGKAALVTLGGIGGGVLGTMLAGTLGTISGPGAIVIGALGGMVGSMIGEMFAEFVADKVGAEPVGRPIVNLFKKEEASLPSYGLDYRPHITENLAPKLESQFVPVANTIQKVADGGALASKGPFTITDRFGATAITAKGDGVVVSPNISYVNDGITDAEPIGSIVSSTSQQNNTVVETTNNNLEEKLETLNNKLNKLVDIIPSLATRPIEVKVDKETLFTATVDSLNRSGRYRI